MKIIKRSLLLSLVAAVMTLYPVTALAEDQPVVDPNQSSAVTTTPTDTSSTTTPPDPVVTPPADPVITPAISTPGPTAPTGADSKKYTYNPATGMYENDFYIWNPVTKQTSPKTPPTYSYNPATGMWDTTQWVYDAPSGKYVANIVETPVTPPASQQTNPMLSPAAALNGNNGIDGTGPDSTNSINNNTTNNGTFNLFYNAAISNNISQNAVSGNALLTGNTTAGNATTGDAANIANVINMLQSTWSPLANGNLTTFTGTIAGNVTGDLMIDPSSIGNTGPGSTQVTNNNTQNNLTVNAQGNGTINNNINVNSQSGDATVAGNTTGGNATTGDASAIVNLVNAINSSIAAGKSFLGTINITGDLNGDILLPPDVLNALLASTGPNSTNTVNNNTSNNLTANITDNTAINNNVNSNAATGTATTAGNTTAGNAASGNAANTINILNLTGKQVVGKDALLVFVNVLGHWTGLIMNAPSGSTAAALGGGISSTGPDSNNSINNNTTNNADINSTMNNTINNNVNVNAASGDASVTHNTTGGNATSGNATTGVNIANINNSNLSFSDWFGVLFINVFGTWNGSFGVNTSAGDPPSAPSAATAGTTAAAAVPQVVKFVSKATNGSANKVVYAAVTTPPADTTTQATQQTTPAVLGSNNTNTPAAAAIQAHQLDLMWVPFVGSGLGLLILLIEEVNRRRSAHKTAGTVATI